jgi:hypothetical protein
MLVPGDCSCCFSADTDSTVAFAADFFTAERGAAVNVKASVDSPMSGVGGAGLHTISAAVAAKQLYETSSQAQCNKQY